MGWISAVVEGVQTCWNAAALHVACVCGRTALRVLTPWSCESRWVPARWHTAPPGGALVPFLEARTPAGKVPEWGCLPHRTGRCSGRRRKAAPSSCGCCRCQNLWQQSCWHWCYPTTRACSPPARDRRGQFVQTDDFKVRKANTGRHKMYFGFGEEHHFETHWVLTFELFVCLSNHSQLLCYFYKYWPLPKCQDATVWFKWAVKRSRVNTTSLGGVFSSCFWAHGFCWFGAGGRFFLSLHWLYGFKGPVSKIWHN